MQRLRSWLRRRRSPGQKENPLPVATAHAQASASLRSLLDDPQIPPAIRNSLASDFAQLEQLLAKLERNELHIAVFGRVSVGKSALANALLGMPAFAVGVLHGTTTQRDEASWRTASSQQIQLIDTPGIDEIGGEAREQLAVDVTSIADLVVFVADGDLNTREHEALQRLADTDRPLLVALNKADRYTPAQRDALLQRLRDHTAAWVRPQNVVAVSADPAPRLRLRMDNDGREHEELVEQAADVSHLRERLKAIVTQEGSTLSAFNAGLFAGRLSDRVGAQIAVARRDLASRVIRQYCLAKGVAVALNPIPVADLLAAATLDAALVMHLARVYGLPMTRVEAGRLIAVISAQLVALMGAIWGTQLVISAFKGLSAGLSTAVTAGAQGALAWYATELVGRAAERYLIAGKSWGKHGPKRVVADIVATLDRDSILRDAREQILGRLRKSSA